MIQLFNIRLNGDDAKTFCEMTREQKISFIKSNSNQKNDDIINEFLLQPLKIGDCGCGCGGSKSVSNGNISKGNAKESTITKQVDSTSGDGKRGVNKGRNKPKTA